MSQKFQKGDIARIKSRELEVEIIEILKKDPRFALCCWVDDADNYHEVYLNIDNLELVKPAPEKVMS